MRISSLENEPILIFRTELSQGNLENNIAADTSLQGKCRLYCFRYFWIVVICRQDNTIDDADGCH